VPVRSLSVAALLAAGLLTALTGCGGDDPASTGSAATSGTSPSSPSSSPSPPASSDTSASSQGSSEGSTAPAGDGRLVGKGYTVALPEGWQDATDQFRDYSPLIDAGALNATQAGQPFSDNLNVLRNPEQAELPPAQAERQFADELGTVASKVRVAQRATVDGVRALHLTGRTEAGEVVALTDQYVCYVDGTYYVTTFSYGSGTPRAQRRQEVSAMLASWSWG
jgi:hypothetical protein